MRFQRAEKLTKDYVEESETLHGDDFVTEKKKELAARNAKKFRSYVLDVPHKDMGLHEIKMLALSIEEGVNKAAEQNGGAMNYKAQY